MQSESTHREHRRRAFLAISSASLLLLILFSIVHHVEGTPWRVGITIGMAVLTAGSMRAILTGTPERAVYRFFCAVISIGLFGLAVLGRDILLYFHLALPLGLFFFLGNREGAIWSAGNLAALLFLLLAMQIPDSLVRETGNVLRFIACYLLISTVAWSYEKLQERFYGVLETRHRQLQREKEQLAAAVKRTEEAESRLERTNIDLKQKTELMETIFNAMSEGMVVADSSGRPLLVNPGAERLVGTGGADTDATRWPDGHGIFFPDRETAFPPDELPLARAIVGQPSDEVDMFVRNPAAPDGVHLSVSGRPLRDESGATKGGVIVFRDVTERVLAQEALADAFAQGRLEIADTILHNIGNAVTSAAEGARTLAEQLADNELVSRLQALGKSLEAHRGDWIPYLQTDPQGRKVLPFILALAEDFSTQNDRLHGTASRVRDRVEHIADIVRTERSLETGRAMTRKNIDLRAAVADAVKLLRESLGKRGIRVDIDCRRAPKEIRIQESRFHQMLVNLTKNGMEAIDALVEAGGLKGEPRIRIRAYVRDALLVLEVTDNGVGVEADNPRILFAAGYSTKQGGSGLGLHSAGNFVVGSGGRIHVLSDGFGKGTTVRVELRLSAVLPRSGSRTPPAGAGSPAAPQKHRARPRNAPARSRS
ncbi:MAG: ATP-binding protein [Acidobacteriota bacterium]|nr:ATP-binding protein [Acidobacteriota bacterium]